MAQALTYTVTGMTCAHCKANVTDGLLAVAGVVDVKVDLDTKLVVAKGTDLDDDVLRAAIVEAGYEATLMSATGEEARAGATARGGTR